MSRSAIEIVACETRLPVAAWLHDELGALDLLDAEIAWMPERMKAVARMLRAGVAEADLPQHSHWNWWNKAYARNGWVWHSVRWAMARLDDDHDRGP
jgi:hypothetical protein